MKHNRLFPEHNEYDTNYIKKYFCEPNVNYCKDEDHVHYNNRNINELIIDLIPDTDYENVHLLYNQDSVNKINYIKINDVKLEYTSYMDAVYTAEESKHYIIKYGLKDPDNFYWILSEQVIEDSGWNAVVLPYNATKLNSLIQRAYYNYVLVPKNVNSIDDDIFNSNGDEIFYNVYFESMTPPLFNHPWDVTNVTYIYVPENALENYINQWRNICDGELVQKLRTFNLDE